MSHARTLASSCGFRVPLAVLRDEPRRLERDADRPPVGPGEPRRLFGERDDLGVGPKTGERLLRRLGQEEVRPESLVPGDDRGSGRLRPNSSMTGSSPTRWYEPPEEEQLVRAHGCRTEVRVIGVSAAGEKRAEATEVVVPPGEVLPGAERRGRVEEREEGPSPPGPRHPGGLGDSGSVRVERRERVGPERDQHLGAEEARAAGRGTDGTWPRPSSGEDVRGGPALEEVDDPELVAGQGRAAAIPSSSRFPDRPTNGSPWRSSSAPGASPTNTTRGWPPPR